MSVKPELMVYGLAVSGLPAMDSNGKADPYLKMTVGRESFRSNTKKATLAASWDEQFYFGRKNKRNDVLAAHDVSIQVWDNDMFRDEKIGLCVVDLSDIKSSDTRTKSTTVPIIGPDGKEKGQLALSLLYLNLPESASTGAAAASASATGGAATPGAAAASASATASSGASTPDASGAGADAEASPAPVAAPNTLKLRIFSARGIRKGDAYIQIGSSSGSSITKTVKNSTDPSFDVSYLIPAPSAESEAVIAVYRKRILRDSLQGAIALKASDFEGQAPRRQWYSLGNKDGVEGDGSRGEIELMVAWEPRMMPVSAPVRFDPATGQPRVGPPTANGQAGDVIPPEEKAESDEERAAKEDEERRRRAMLEGMELVKGDYKVLVHIHEARQLKDEDLNASVDPCVRVEVMGQRQQTKTAWMTNSVVFDHLMYFSFKDLDPEQLETGTVAIRVFDVDRFTRDDLVGSYTLDIPYIFFRENHEMHMQWLGITDPTDKRKKGLMGYLKVSVAVLGPGHKRKVWDPAEEARLLAKERDRGLESIVMMPPSIDRKVEFLVITVYEARNLMPMDKPQAGGLLKGGIDAYMQVDFAGNPAARTQWVAKKVKGDEAINVIWRRKNQLWIPVMVPTMTTAVRCSMYDYDLATRDDLVGSFYLNFRNLRETPVHKRWFNLYGAAEGLENGIAMSMNEFPQTATHFRGRVLLSAEVVRRAGKEEVEHVHVKSSQLPVFMDPAAAAAAAASASASAAADASASASASAAASASVSTPGPAALPEDISPPTRKYTLRALVVSGTDVPSKFNPLSRNIGLVKGAEMVVEVAVAGTVLATKKAVVDRGVVWWGEQLSATLELPVDPAQVPDVFLYLRRGARGPRVAFARWPGAELVQEDDPFDALENPCEWVPLIEDKAVDALADNQQPGSILCRLAFAPAELEAVDETWLDDLERAAKKGVYELRVHLYQARNLPAADSTGSSDPFVRVQVSGVCRDSRIKPKTISPQYYETMCFPELELSSLIEFRPPVTLQVYDHDRFTSDDFISEMRMPLGDDRVLNSIVRDDGTNDFPSELPDPEWYPLSALGREEDGPQGEVLVAFQLIEMEGVKPGEMATAKPPRPVSIVPEMEAWNIEVLALGMRNLQPYLGLPIANPCIEMDLGDKSKAEAVKTTKHSNFPSGQDPNFCQRVIIPCMLPKREIFAPALNLAVVDRRLGGYFTPLVGTATIPLVDKIPGTASYIPPMGSVQTENLHFRDMSEAEKSNPPVFPKSARVSADAKSDPVMITRSPSDVGAATDTDDLQLELDGVPIDIDADAKATPPSTPGGSSSAIGAGVPGTPFSAVSGAGTHASKHKRRRKLAAPSSHAASAEAVRAAAAEQAAMADAASGAGGAAVAALAQARVAQDVAASHAASEQRSRRGTVDGFSGGGDMPVIEERVGSSGLIDDGIVLDGITTGGVDLAPGMSIGSSPLLSLGAAEGTLAGADVAHASATAQLARERQSASMQNGSASGAMFRTTADGGNVALDRPVSDGDALGSTADAAAAGGVAEAAAAGSAVDVSFLSRHLKLADGAISQDGTPRFHPEDKAAKYMRHRRVYERGLEEALQTAPFETIPVMRGQDVGRGHIFGWKLPSTKRRVGVFKGIVRVIKDASAEPPAGWAKILEPKQYEVRAYVLNGYGMRPMDKNMRSDCYLVGKLGKDRISHRNDFVPKSIDPPLYKVLKFTTMLPGPSNLELQMWDYDSVTFDDFIGKTVIDLEDRWFDPRWQSLGRGFETKKRFAPKPLEERRIFTPDRWEDTGTLQVWVDILEPAQAKDYPEVDIEPPPPREFECRVVVWRTWGVPSNDWFTDMNDLYVRGWLEGSPAQSTDVHLRCKKGRGSFNWRMVFPTTVPCKNPILHLQMWDRDYLDVSDLIAQSDLDLGQHFEGARHYRGRYMVMDRIRDAFEGLVGVKFDDLHQPASGLEEDESDTDGEEGGKVDVGAGVTTVAGAKTRGSGSAKGDATPLLNGSASGSAESDEHTELLGGDGEDGSGPGASESVSVPVLTSAVVAAEQAEAAQAQAKQRGGVAGKAVNAAGRKQALKEAERRRKTAQEASMKEFGVEGEEVGTAGDSKAEAGGVGAMADAESKAEAAEEEKAAAATIAQAKQAVGVPVHPHAENAAWLPMYQAYGKDEDGNKVMLPTPQYMGKVLVSIELVPADVAESMPVGRGRSAPNENPHLPPPAGRMHFSLNPFYLGRECLGPKVFGNCLLCLCGIVGILAVFFGAPFIDAIMSFVSALGDPLGTVLSTLLLIVVIGPVLYICVKYIWCPGGPSILTEAASDNHTYLDLLQVQQSHESAAEFGFKPAGGTAAAPQQQQVDGSATGAAVGINIDVEESADATSVPHVQSAPKSSAAAAASAAGSTGI